MKKLSVYLPLLVGLFSVAVQIVVYYARFGHWNASASFVDYLLFFLSGALGGLILFYFLKRQTSSMQRWVVSIAFLMASPIALILMIGGGMPGWLGVLIFPQIPWTLLMWLGTLAGRLAPSQ